MIRRRIFLIGFCLTLSPYLQANTVFAPDLAVQISVTVQKSPAQITLAWPNTPYRKLVYAGYTVYRKSLTDTSWGNPIATLPGTNTSWIDANVSVGTAYEYQIIRSGIDNNFTPAQTFFGYGYVYAGIEIPAQESRGKLILLVDNTIAATLATELQTLQQDLVGDGWEVIRQDVVRGVTPSTAGDPNVVTIKNIIKGYFNADPANVKALFLFGHVPVPYSGDIAPDGHAVHLGAWPADMYYGDMTGTWTDTAVTTTNNANLTPDPVPPAYANVITARTVLGNENQNIPGDGKFDQSNLPADGNMALQIGRVDFFNMPQFVTSAGKDEVTLLRQYLNKDHKYRQNLPPFTNIPRRILFDDGYNGGFRPYFTGLMNADPLVGPARIDSADWTATLPTQSYLWSYGLLSGNFTAIDNVITTAQAATLDLHTIFSTVEGSLSGDWNHQDDVVRALIGGASYTLGSVWMACGLHYHHMGLGETLGYGMKTTMNDRLSGGLYPNPLGSTFSDAQLASVSLGQMGDPTIRLFPVTPASGAVASVNGQNITVQWTASPDTVAGYYVYRASTANGPFARVSGATPIAGTAFTDTNVTGGTYWYMIRAIALTTSGSGSYFNPSEGVVVSITTNGNTAPQVNAGIDQTIALPNVATLAGVATDDGLPNPPHKLTTTWSKLSGPGTVVFGNPSALSTFATFSQAGIYVLNLHADDSALSADDQLTVTVTPANAPPTVNAGTDQTITLPAFANLSATVTDDHLPNPPDAVTVTWSQVSGPGTVTFGNVSSVSTTASFSTAGSYVLKLTASDSLLSASDTLTVTVNPQPPQNQPPSVNAGPDQNIIGPAGTTASLHGTEVDDNLPNPPGKVTLVWSTVSGPGPVTIQSPSLLNTLAAFSIPGVYVLRLTADDSALSSSDDVTITFGFPNQPPVVSAGADQSIEFPNPAQLAGTATDDGLPNPPGALTFLWSKISGPGNLSFSNKTLLQTNVSFSQPGTYVINLDAQDGALSADSTLTVTVSAPNVAPTVDAGPDLLVGYPGPAVLHGVWSDDGLPNGQVSLLWSMVSGPGMVVFSAPSKADTTATFSAPGMYLLRFTADDGEATASDDVNVSVVANAQQSGLLSKNPLHTNRGESFCPSSHDGKTEIRQRDGQLVKTLDEGQCWDGKNERGEKVAAGVYFTSPGKTTKSGCW